MRSTSIPVQAGPAALPASSSPQTADRPHYPGLASEAAKRLVHQSALAVDVIRFQELPVAIVRTNLLEAVTAQAQIFTVLADVVRPDKLVDALLDPKNAELNSGQILCALAIDAAKAQGVIRAGHAAADPVRAPDAALPAATPGFGGATTSVAAFRAGLSPQSLSASTVRNLEELRISEIIRPDLSMLRHLKDDPFTKAQGYNEAQLGVLIKAMFESTLRAYDAEAIVANFIRNGGKQVTLEL